MQKVVAAMRASLVAPSQPAALQRLQQRPGASARPCRSHTPTCSSTASPTEQPRPERRQDGGVDAPSLSRMQLVRGGLLAASGMVFGAAAPPQAAQAAQAAASEAAVAVASADVGAAAAQHFSKVGGAPGKCTILWC